MGASDRLRHAAGVAPDALDRYVEPVRQRKAGHERILGETTPDIAVGATLRLSVEVRDTDYTLAITVGSGPAVTVAIADGAQLDSVATGGFIGLVLGMYATSNGAESDTVVEIDSVEYTSY